VTTETQDVAADAAVMAAPVFAVQEITQAELDDMGTAELIAYLAEHGTEIDPDELRASVAAALEADAPAIRGGLTDAGKRAAVEKKVKSLVESTARRITRDTVRKSQMAAWDLADDREWDRKFYMWVSVGSGVCDSCHSLHGQVFALDQWESIGIPGSGSTICGDRCRCTLVPGEGTDREVTRRRNDAARAGLEDRT
jgi:hypothetical protein